MKIRGARIGFLGVQILADVLCIALSIHLTNLAFDWWHPHPADPRRTLERAFIIAITLLCFYLCGVYRNTKSLMNIEETRSLLKGLLLAMMVIFFVFAITPHENVIAGPVLLSNSILFILVNSFRFLLFKLEQHLHIKGITSRRVLILGTGPMCEKLIHIIREQPKLGFRPLGIVVEDSLEASEWLGIPVVGKASEIEAILERMDLDEVIATRPPSASFGDDSKELAFLSLCQRKRIGVNWLPDVEQTAIQRMVAEDLAGCPLIQMRELRLDPWNELIKRLFDLSVALTLLMLLGWLMALIALFVKVTSRGPVIFSQERVGMDGKLFRIWKFRTMLRNVAPYQKKPLDPEDPRVTPLGRILRRLSLDELPQLFNVIMGSMSLVGPRPEMAFIVDQYTHIERERLNVKPGITGLWQISTARGRDIHENIEYDLYYIREWSLILDLAILLKTLISAVVGTGAL